MQPKYHPIARWVAKANISCDLSTTASFTWHWSEDVSKYTSVPEDIYTSTVTILKNDEQAPSADGNQKIHQNQSIFSRENIKRLTSWRGAHSIFSDQFLSLSHLLHLSPLLSSTAAGGHSPFLAVPPPPACRETPAVPCCTHRQASQNSGKSHLLEVYESDILKNFKPESMHRSSYHNYYIYYISWQVHLKLQGAKAQFVSIACSKLSLPAAVRKNSIGTNTVFSFPNALWSLTSSRFQKSFAWHHLQRERSPLPLATQQKSAGDEWAHLLLATNGAFFLKQALYVLIHSVRRQTRLKQNPVS